MLYVLVLKEIVQKNTFFKNAFCDVMKSFAGNKRPVSTMKLSFVLVFAFILPLIRAQVPHWGPCPEPAVQPAFTLKQVQATLYRIWSITWQTSTQYCPKMDCERRDVLGSKQMFLFSTVTNYKLYFSEWTSVTVLNFKFLLVSISSIFFSQKKIKTCSVSCYIWFLFQNK